MDKRINVDRWLALILAPIVLVLLGVLFVIVVPLQGRPFFYTCERMKTRDTSFRLIKIRTLHPPDPEAELSALGGHMLSRVTPVGALLRKTRLDELPQIFNVIRGDMRFIGPRPQLRKYVEAYPDLFDAVLRETPPGITGLATVVFHEREERLLAACRSAEETDEVYRRRCIAIKARLDLIYRERRGFKLNLWILWHTFARLSLPPVRMKEQAQVASMRVIAAE